MIDTSHHEDVLSNEAWQIDIKRIVHFEINFWYVLSYLKRIQDV